MRPSTLLRNDHTNQLNEKRVEDGIMGRGIHQSRRWRRRQKQNGTQNVDGKNGALLSTRLIQIVKQRTVFPVCRDGGISRIQSDSNWTCQMSGVVCMCVCSQHMRQIYNLFLPIPTIPYTQTTSPLLRNVILYGQPSRTKWTWAQGIYCIQLWHELTRLWRRVCNFVVGQFFSNENPLSLKIIITKINANALSHAPMFEDAFDHISFGLSVRLRTTRLHAMRQMSSNCLCSFGRRWRKFWRKKLVLKICAGIDSISIKHTANR